MVMTSHWNGGEKTEAAFL